MLFAEDRGQAATSAENQVRHLNVALEEINMNLAKSIALGLLVLGQGLVSTAYAVPVTVSGTNYDFTYDDSLVGLFGQPTVSGDTLYFTPTDFKSQSSNGAGYVATTGTVNIVVTAHAGQSFGSVDLAERGDYLLLGSGSSADVTGQVRVFDTAMPLVDMTSVVTPNSPLTMVGTPAQNWSANASANVSGWTSATQLNITLENLLLASTSSANSFAFVEKKFAGLTITTPVPEAQTSSMLLAGLGLIGFVVARRRKAVTLK
jgi:PEP-CTERM putative exosortase interaction domain